MPEPVSAADAHVAAPSRDDAAARPWLAPLLVAAAGAAAYANALHGPFLFDDTQPTGELSLNAEQKRPLYWLSFALNRAISGQETWSYHALNVLVHVACGLVLLAFLGRAMGLHGRPGPRARRGLALATALVWVLHPLQTGAVSYVTQRSESLAALCYLSFLYAFARAFEPRARLAWQALALVFLSLGLATKETVATAPVLAWLFVATVVARGRPASARPGRGFHAALALVWCVLLALFIAPPLLSSETSAGFGLREVTPLQYARSQPGVICHYLSLAFWPHPLCLDYGWPVASGAGEILPQGLALAALLGLTLWKLLARSWLGFAGAWFFVILAPTSSFVPIKDLAFEHRMYLPLAAVAFTTLVAAWSAGRALGLAPRAGWLALGGLCAALAAATWRRNLDYGDEIRMWRSVIAARPANQRAYENLSAPLIRAGRIDEAVEVLETALRIGPYSAVAVNNLAAIHMDAGRVDEAIALLSEALVRDPGYALSYHNLGNCYLRRNELRRALFYYERALALFGAPYTHRDLGIVHARLGDRARAEAHFRRALELDPHDAAARAGLEELVRGR